MKCTRKRKYQMEIMDIEEKIDDLLVAFHEAVDILYSSTLTDPSFNRKFHGYGFNGIGVPVGRLTYGLPNSFEDYVSQSDYFGLLSNYGSIVTHALNNAIAIDSKLQLSDQNYLNQWKVVFYINKREIPGAVELSLSSRGFCGIQGLYKDFSEAVRITHLNDDRPKFTFSSAIANKKLNSLSGNLAIVRPKALLAIEIKSNNNVKVKPLMCENLGDNMQGIKSMFAIFCPDWPQEAYTLISRKKPNQWPTNQLIEKITNQGIHLVPEPCNEPDVRNANGLWTYSFHQAEKELLKSSSNKVKGLYKMLFGFVEPVEQLCNIHNSVLHQLLLHSLFWFTEQHFKEHIVDKESSSKRETLINFLNILLENIKAHKVCNYFIPEIDLLKDIDKLALLKLQETLECLANDMEFLEDVISDTTLSSAINVSVKPLDEAHKEVFLQSVISKITENLTSAFDGIIKVACQASFAKLHLGENIDASIEFHQSVILAMKEMQCTTTHLKDWCMRLVSNSLGSLYLAKAQVSQEIHSKTNGFFSKSLKRVPTSETAFYIQKAEELLLTGNNIDLMSGRVRLANFYFMNHQFQECHELLQEIFHVTAQTQPNQHRELSKKPEADEGISYVFFLRDLIDRNIILDMLFSKMDKNTICPFITKSIELTKSQLLGIQTTDIYVLDADIYAHLLLAMSHFYLGRRPKTTEELAKLVNLWDKSQSDMNDKRSINYLNAIAFCYLEIGEKEEAIKTFETSVKKMANPGRNPARFKLIVLKTEKTREVAKRTVSVALGVAVVATIVSVVRNKLFD